VTSAARAWPNRRSPGVAELASPASAAVLPFAAWVLAVFAVAIVARAVLPVSDAPAVGGGSWLPLANFDAAHYFEIARHGYSGSVVSRAFFPLFPLLVAGVHGLLHVIGATVSYALAGTVIAVACAYGALRVLRSLLALDLGQDVANRAVWVLAVAPYAFILLAPYTESVLLLTSVGSFLAARRQRWWLAGALGAGASACRLPGLIVFPALLVEYLYQVRRSEQPLSRDILAVALAPLGAVGYFAWLGFHGGISTYSRAYTIGWPYRKFTLNVFKPLYNPILAHVFHDAVVPSTSLADALGLMSFIATAGLLMWGWKWLRPSYRVYAAASVVVPLLTTITEGLGRYYLVIFPLALIAAKLAQEHPRLVRPAVCAGILGEVVLTALFVSGHPGVV
jgi:Gpi18-like mannosyltransferase